MNNKIIPQSSRVAKLNEIQKLIKEFSDEPTIKLINFCREKGFKDRDLAQALGIHKNEFSRKYPREVKNYE